MHEADFESQYEEVEKVLESCWHNQALPEFGAAVSRLELIAQAGMVEAAESLAEILALPGPLHDPAAAYKWYYIALSQQGYSVEFNDRNDSPPYYGGNVGDFRNESMVNGLVVELGFERVKQLDVEAAAWSRSRPQSECRPTTG